MFESGSFVAWGISGSSCEMCSKEKNLATKISSSSSFNDTRWWAIFSLLLVIRDRKTPLAIKHRLQNIGLRPEIRPCWPTTGKLFDRTDSVISVGCIFSLVIKHRGRKKTKSCASYNSSQQHRALKNENFFSFFLLQDVRPLMMVLLLHSFLLSWQRFSKHLQFLLKWTKRAREK